MLQVNSTCFQIVRRGGAAIMSRLPLWAGRQREPSRILWSAFSHESVPVGVRQDGLQFEYLPTSVDCNDTSLPIALDHPASTTGHRQSARHAGPRCRPRGALDFGLYSPAWPPAWPRLPRAWPQRAAGYRQPSRRPALPALSSRRCRVRYPRRKQSSQSFPEGSRPSSFAFAKSAAALALLPCSW